MVNMDIFKLDFNRIHLLEEFKTAGMRHIFIHLCTAIGAWGGYPTPPLWWQDFVNSHELVKWFLLAVLIFQGGDEQEFQMAIEFTILFYLAYHFSNKLYAKIGPKVTKARKALQTRHLFKKVKKDKPLFSAKDKNVNEIVKKEVAKKVKKEIKKEVKKQVANKKK